MVQITAAGGVSAAEVARFDALAGDWWAPDGPLAPLHRMNPVRIDWIGARIAAQFGPTARPALLDVGCGAGIAAEALARRGHAVLGVDAAAAPLEAARAHASAAETPLDLTYRNALLADLLAEGAQFPVVTALEVIEHVPEPADFVAGLAGLVGPGGLLVLSTLNRSLRARLFAKYAAEYVLRWVPPGTHDWHSFVKPAELAAMARAAGLHVSAVSGISIGLDGRFRLSHDTAINYLLAAVRPGG